MVLGASGALLLVGLVALGAGSQAGITLCSLGGGSPPSPLYCPTTYPAIFVLLLAFTIPSAMLATAAVTGGDSPRSHSASLDRIVAINSTPKRSALFGPAMTVFFGLGLFLWGLFLPLPEFGLCHGGPCVYPYELQGVPLALVVIGGTLFGVGLTILVSVSRLIHGRGSGAKRISA